MTLDELKAIVWTRKAPHGMAVDIPSDNYAWEDRCCLINERDGWSVFYFERGHRMDECQFLSEEAAVERFISLSKRAGIW